MFDHVKFGVSDYAASRTFFLKALEPLGVVAIAEGSPTYGLCLYQTEEKPAHHHANYYAAFVIGPDGHNIEVVCHADET